MGASQRQKGARGERVLAALLRDAFPEHAGDIRRGWQSRMGCDDCDVTGLPGFWLEHKQGLQPNMRGAYKQAKTDCKKRAMPVAVVQDDGARERMVVIGLSDFIRVLRSAYGYLPPLRYGVQQELPLLSPEESAAIREAVRGTG